MTGSFKERLKSIFSNDFFAAAVFLIAYLCTNSYIFGWDDQHLEVPVLKHLIDPSLYKGDYYVESLAKNFSSFFYPLLAKFIKTSQVETVYLILFLVARYFVFFFLYKLWKFISKDKFSAVCAIFMFIVLGRTEEFLYRTFSHQVVGECFMFAGIYLFYKERFMLAALTVGLAANIHGIYNLFPMIFMLVFLVLFHPKRWSMAFKTGLTFMVACSPFLWWQIPRSLQDKLSGPSIPLSEWMPLYQAACPQNFLFPNYPTFQQAFANRPFFIQCLEPYFFLIGLYCFLLWVYPSFRKDKKVHVIVGTSIGLIIISTIFSYAVPSRFVIDLNLIRCEQFIRLFLMAYATFWAIWAVKEAKPWQALLSAVIFLFIGFGSWLQFIPKFQKNIWVLICMGMIFVALSARRWDKMDLWLRKALIIIPLLGAFIGFCKFHYQFIQIKHHGSGFWQMQRNWEDMQRYVRDHTPKEAKILAPVNEDIGGFRIQSERTIVVCNRDCGIIGFDYAAAVEWRRRMDDMKGYVIMTQKSIDEPVLTAILKYKVDYIVFMKYYEPRGNNPVFKKVYENEVFSLFQVMVHP